MGTPLSSYPKNKGWLDNASISLHAVKYHTLGTLVVLHTRDLNSLGEFKTLTTEPINY